MTTRMELIAKKQPIELIEPDKGYGLWEKLYGRELDQSEKYEIETNLISFFEILINENQRNRKAQ